MELVAEYGRTGAEAPFAELVRRHVPLVYSVAFRQTGLPAQAEEITQVVFIALARKAGRMRPDTVLEGWLYETARLTALSFLRGERRRQFREQETYMQSTLEETGADPVWERLAPLLDEVMAQLGPTDRDAVVLRFFKDKSVREVALALQVNEATAQRRILRALEKLRKLFARRGVSSTTALIAEAITAHSVQAAPVALAKSVTAVALLKGVAVSSSTSTLINGALKLMAWTKLKTVGVVGAVALLVVGSTLVATHALTPARASDPGTASRPGANDTPEAAFNSLLAGMAAGNIAQVQNACSQQVWDLLRSKMGDDDTKVRRVMMQDGARMATSKIVQKEVLTDAEVNLHISDGTARGPLIIAFQKFGNEWKFVGEGHTGQVPLDHSQKASPQAAP